MTPDPSRYALLAALGLLLNVSGCGILGDGTRHFTIQVDSISVPAAVGPQEPLGVRFFGMVGPNGCYAMTEVVSGRSPSLLQVEFRGEYRDAVCIQEPVPLHHQMTLQPPFSDPFTIRVLQPSGPSLEKSVRVQ